MFLPRIAAAAFVIAALAAVTIAIWPDSEADKARADGEQVGVAVADVYYADSESEANAALADLEVAIADTREHAGDELAEHVAEQQEALSYAVDGYVGANTTSDEWEAALYQEELEYAVDDLADEANDFRAQGPEVRQAFWDGVADGLDRG